MERRIRGLELVGATLLGALAGFVTAAVVLGAALADEALTPVVLVGCGLGLACVRPHAPQTNALLGSPPKYR